MSHPASHLALFSNPEWVDQLATISGLRDRDLLDVSLAGALRALLRLRSVAVYRCVGQLADQRWLLRARLGQDDLAASSDGAWLEFTDLPPVGSRPEMLHCLRTREVTQSVDPKQRLARTHFPLASDREVVGVLELHSQKALNLSEQRLVASVLRLYGNVLGLLDYSERDTLTGLLNRKTFDDSFMRLAAALPSGQADIADFPNATDDADLQDETAPAPRRHSQSMAVWLGVVDIDHFKRVNDTHGHLIGDEVLLLLSRLMRNCFRFDDQIYRFGGEEFVILLRCAGATDAGLAFQRLREHVQSFEFPRVGRLTVSIGFSEVRAADTPSNAFERADRAVYVAKQQGRNQVHEFAALVAAGLLDDDTRASEVELF